MSHQLHRLALAFIGGFLLITGTATYWSFAARDQLLERPDNPRRLLAERRFGRGTIYDRNDQVLAEFIGGPGDYTRHYPYSLLAPVLGYVSPFYGSAGIEAAADRELHGDPPEASEVFDWSTLGLSALGLSAPPAGRAIRLSIDLELQKAADTALAEYPGAVVVLDATTGEILALASHPTYDANQFETDWRQLVADKRALLLNRATLSLYQPGGALQPIILAGALRAGLAEPAEKFPAGTEPLALGNLTLECLQTPPSSTLADAFQASCPWPFAVLGKQLGAHTLEQLFADFRLFEAPPLPIPAIAAERAPFPDALSAALGQSSLTLSPLQLALTTAAIAHRGELPAPRLLLAAQDAQGNWQPVAAETHSIAALAPEFAEEVKALMRAGHTATAQTDAQGGQVAWYSGFAPFDNPRYVVTVLLEEGRPTAAAQIGQEVLRQATLK